MEELNKALEELRGAVKGLIEVAEQTNKSIKVINETVEQIIKTL